MRIIAKSREIITRSRDFLQNLLNGPNVVSYVVGLTSDNQC